MPSEARQKKIVEKLNRAQKCSILGPQNLGSGGARAPGPPPWIRTCGMLMMSADWPPNYHKIVRTFPQM